MTPKNAATLAGTRVNTSGGHRQPEYRTARPAPSTPASTPTIPRWAALRRAACERCEHRFNVSDRIEFGEDAVSCPRCRSVQVARPEPPDAHAMARILGAA